MAAISWILHIVMLWAKILDVIFDVLCELSNFCQLMCFPFHTVTNVDQQSLAVSQGVPCTKKHRSWELHKYCWSDWAVTKEPNKTDSQRNKECVSLIKKIWDIVTLEMEITLLYVRVFFWNRELRTFDIWLKSNSNFRNTFFNRNH